MLSRMYCFLVGMALCVKTACVDLVVVVGDSELVVLMLLLANMQDHLQRKLFQHRPDAPLENKPAVPLPM